ncbi:hypothetical protein Poli38472_006859 [Pythium oligandrum]|uniref:Ricin B lectin domain-containing protein n=1 Tax=Pythium oligandrum TaxID=41045 RepID=A0A8K1FDF5_PYTOL|nr:hypothetical protein Poli38472_006859 [Pythium oligandrum]|eukprot:TMW56849.1 hypothetical protein Poli38472_006859 [Pythium oligandrum]
MKSLVLTLVYAALVFAFASGEDTPLALEANGSNGFTPAIKFTIQLANATNLCLDDGGAIGGRFWVQPCTNSSDQVFVYDNKTDLIHSASKVNACVAFNPAGDIITMTCDDSSFMQHFAFNTTTQQIQVARSPVLCFDSGAGDIPTPNTSVHIEQCSPSLDKRFLFKPVANE